MTGANWHFTKQFAITMVSVIVISGIVALTLTPVLSAMILKPHDKEGKKENLIGKF